MNKLEKRRIVYSFLLIIFIFICLMSSYKIYTIINDSKSTKNNLIYTSSNDVSYKLNITDNEYIKTNDLEKYDTYISSLVQSIDMNFNYRYKGSEKLSLDIKHRVIATIYGLYNDNPTEKMTNPIMWKKEFILKDYVEKKYENIDQFSIDEKVNLDWQMFNNDVISFMANLSLPTVAYLEVNLEVEYYGNSDKYNLSEKQAVYAKMPLNEQVFSIEKSNNDDVEKFISSKDIDVLNREQRKLTAYIILVSSSLILILITIKLILSSKEKQPFNEIMEGLKNNYDEIIVETKSMIDTKGLKPVTISSFDEMLNLADSLLLPIMLYQETNKSIFYIVKNDMIYIYMMKNKSHYKNKNIEE